MTKIKGLQCRECGRPYPAKPLHVCEFCFGPLEVHYDYATLQKIVTRKRIETGPPTMWRYRDLLPIEQENPVGKHCGMTPLTRAKNLAEALGAREVYIKNDAVCHPSLSFKDRVVAVAVTKAMEFGFEVVSCASTGNLANSVAAHAAEAGLKSFIFVPADLEQGKIVTTAVYGATIVAIKGNYDEVNRLCAEVADAYPWAFVNTNVRPFYSEGSKTLSFEVVEQLGWTYPDHIVVPIGSGAQLVKVRKGLGELHTVGLTDAEPHTKVHGAQAVGCAPVAEAFAQGLEHEAHTAAALLGGPAEDELTLGNDGLDGAAAHAHEALGARPDEARAAAMGEGERIAVGKALPEPVEHPQWMQRLIGLWADEFNTVGGTPEQVRERFDHWLARQESAGRTFTPEQLRWLEMIRDQVATSMGIEVMTPCPISSWVSTMVTLSSDPIFNHTLGSSVPAALAVNAARRPGMVPPIRKAPAVALTLRKARRLSSFFIRLLTLRPSDGSRAVCADTFRSGKYFRTSRNRSALPMGASIRLISTCIRSRNPPNPTSDRAKTSFNSGASAWSAPARGATLAPRRTRGAQYDARKVRWGSRTLVQIACPQRRRQSIRDRASLEPHPADRDDTGSAISGRILRQLRHLLR